MAETQLSDWQYVMCDDCGSEIVLTTRQSEGLVLSCDCPNKSRSTKMKRAKPFEWS